MKKFFQIALVLVVSMCYVTNVKAATKQDLINYASKTFTIAGKKISSPEMAAIVKSYLAENDVTEAKADQIIAKADQIVAIMNEAGVTDPTKLSASQKNRVSSLATEAASLAGATINYDVTSKKVTVKSQSGKVYGAASLVPTKLAATGANYTIYVAMSGIAVIITTILLYRKQKANA